MPTMPFGKHIGQQLSDVPDSYLRWLLTIDLKPWLRAAVLQEISDRDRPPEPPPPPKNELKAAVRSWHRALALKYHPDRGGSHEAMIAINHAYDDLIAVLRDRGLICDD